MERTGVGYTSGLLVRDWSSLDQILGLKKIKGNIKQSEEAPCWVDARLLLTLVSDTQLLVCCYPPNSRGMLHRVGIPSRQRVVICKPNRAGALCGSSQKTTMLSVFLAR